MDRVATGPGGNQGGDAEVSGTAGAGGGREMRIFQVPQEGGSGRPWAGYGLPGLPAAQSVAAGRSLVNPACPATPRLLPPPRFYK